MLRVLDAVEALTPPDPLRRRHGPKRLPEKASHIVGHFLLIDAHLLVGTYKTTDGFKELFGSRSKNNFRLVGANARALFNLAFDMDHPALRANGKGAVTTIRTDGYSASVSRERKPDAVPVRGERTDYLDQATLRRFLPHQIVGGDPGKRFLVTAYRPHDPDAAPDALGRRAPTTFRYGGHRFRRQAGMPRAERQMILRKRSTVVAGDPLRRSIEALETALGTRDARGGRTRHGRAGARRRARAAGARVRARLVPARSAASLRQHDARDGPHAQRL